MKLTAGMSVEFRIRGLRNENLATIHHTVVQQCENFLGTQVAFGAEYLEKHGNKHSRIIIFKILINRDCIIDPICFNMRQSYYVAK
jgi:hypothetical protein